MSLVGPRPPLPDEVACYEPDAIRRLRVQPGLTGLWQVSGRSDLSWEESLRLDLWYVDNWSLTLDLQILFPHGPRGPSWIWSLLMNTHADRWPRAQRSLLGAALAAASLLALAGCATAEATAAQGPLLTVSDRQRQSSSAFGLSLPDQVLQASRSGSRPPAGQGQAGNPFGPEAHDQRNRRVVHQAGGLQRRRRRPRRQDHQLVRVGNGPGVFPGRPNTTISLQLKNGTSRAMSLTQVVVSARYGTPARLAPAVYNGPAAHDFSGVLAPGATASAT